MPDLPSLLTLFTWHFIAKRRDIRDNLEERHHGTVCGLVGREQRLFAYPACIGKMHADIGQ